MFLSWDVQNDTELKTKSLEVMKIYKTETSKHMNINIS
jgi:hypothetical protein